MYDFVKIRRRISSPEMFVRESGLPFVEGSRTDTGEIIDHWKAKYSNLNLTVYRSGIVILKGSLHKYRNGGRYNHDDFTIWDHKRVIDELIQRIDLNLYKFVIDTLEVGVNISPPIDSTILLDNTYRHKAKAFKDISFGLKGDFREAQYSDYFVKIYNKGIQYHLPYDLLRFEIKLKADMLRKLHIHLLQDTLDTSIVAMLQNLLLERYSEVVFIDPTIRVDELTEKQQERLSKWKNPRYWEDLQNNPPSKNSYANEIRILCNIIAKKSERINDQVKSCIAKKLGELAPAQPRFNFLSVGRINGRVQGHFLEENVNSRNSNIIPILPPIRKCRVTGLDISMQNEDSVFISAKGVAYYHNNDPIAFDWLKENYSPNGINKYPLKEQFSKIAHGVRHHDSDKRHTLTNQLNRICSCQTLFPLTLVLNNDIIRKYRVPAIVVRHYGI